MARKSTVDKKAELLAQIAREEQEAKDRRNALMAEIRRVEKAEADKHKARLNAMATSIGKKIVAVNEELTDSQVSEIVAFVQSRFGSNVAAQESGVVAENY